MKLLRTTNKKHCNILHEVRQLGRDSAAGMSSLGEKVRKGSQEAALDIEAMKLTLNNLCGAVQQISPSVVTEVCFSFIVRKEMELNSSVKSKYFQMAQHDYVGDSAQGLVAKVRKGQMEAVEEQRRKFYAHFGVDPTVAVSDARVRFPASSWLV